MEMDNVKTKSMAVFCIVKMYSSVIWIDFRVRVGIYFFVRY